MLSTKTLISEALHLKPPERFIVIEPGFCNRNAAPRRQRRVQIWQKKVRAYSGVCKRFFLTKMRPYLAANAVFYCKFRVEALIKSLDVPNPQIEKAWAIEAEKRLSAYKAGKLKTVSL